MENASKALIMAGAILITLLIISLSVVVFRNMSGAVDRNANMDKQKITAFNEKIIPYTGENVGGSQVNALIQLIRAINQKANNDQDEQRKITLAFGTQTYNSDAVQLPSAKVGTYYIVTAKQNSYGFMTQITINEQQ